MRVAEREVENGRTDDTPQKGNEVDTVEVSTNGLSTSLSTKTEEGKTVITDEDVSNLKTIFDWAIQVIGSNRERLTQVLYFEDRLLLKLKTFKDSKNSKK